MSRRFDFSCLFDEILYIPISTEEYVYALRLVGVYVSNPKMRDLPGMFFVEFVVKLVDLGFRAIESFLPGSSDLVNTPLTSSDDLQVGSEKPSSLHSMEQWIKCAGSDAITMMPKFLHHRKAEDVLVKRVDEDMDSNQTGKKFPLMLKHTVNISSRI